MRLARRGLRRAATPFARLELVPLHRAAVLLLYLPLAPAPRAGYLSATLFNDYRYESPVREPCQAVERVQAIIGKRGAETRWPASRLKIASTRSRTGSISFCWRATARGWCRRARRSLWNATTTRTPSWRF